MTWVNLSTAFAYGTKLTSTQMQNLRDNIAAAFNKDGGAPVLANNYVVEAMINALAVTGAKIGAGAVTEPKLGAGAVTKDKLAAGTDERDWVLARTAGAVAGSVGTYAMLASTTSYDIGDTAAGSSLKYAGLSGTAYSTSTQVVYDGSTLPTGTWRCMGRCQLLAGNDYVVSLWLRIS